MLDMAKGGGEKPKRSFGRRSRKPVCRRQGGDVEGVYHQALFDISEARSCNPSSF